MIATSVLTLTLLGQAQATPEPEQKYGHSNHGSAFDTGMRTKPWKIDGIGNVDFPITTTHPETQAWFNQAMALMQNFWWEEARRTLRWCHKLEPENPMVLWAMAFGAQNGRGGVDPQTFYTKAYQHRAKATQKEKDVIEAYYNAIVDGTFDYAVLTPNLKELTKKYPDDPEILFQAVNATMYNEPVYADKLIHRIFAIDPQHPGANHLLIHTWDARDNKKAIIACERYGNIAPASGHANHMPGHIYSKIGMWKEAAWAMDKAARVELKYMNDRLALPFETWNYSHNRNYLIYIQEHLGMADFAISGAKNLLQSPRDPDYNDIFTFGEGNQGLMALTRSLIRFQKWDEILNPKGWSWPTSGPGGYFMKLAEAHAYIATEDYESAQKAIAELEGPNAIPIPGQSMDVAILQGKLARQQGKLKEAEGAFDRAVNSEERMRQQFYLNDPPYEAVTGYYERGQFHLSQGNYEQAIKDYHKALAFLPGDPWSLMGLARAHKSIGNPQRAKIYAGQVFYLWSNADPDMEAYVELKKEFTDEFASPTGFEEEREYHPNLLDQYGPSGWQPFNAPKLEGTDSKGNPVSLDQFKGKNVIVVYYLSDECVHCMEQLVALNENAKEFEEEETVVLAISSATPAELADSEKLGELDLILVSDTNHENARRWSSYDDFEEMELHSTVLIDKEGKVRWKRTGGDPFEDVSFLFKELTRIKAPQGG